MARKDLSSFPTISRLVEHSTDAFLLALDRSAAERISVAPINRTAEPDAFESLSQDLLDLLPDEVSSKMSQAATARINDQAASFGLGTQHVDLSADRSVLEQIEAVDLGHRLSDMFGSRGPSSTLTDGVQRALEEEVEELLSSRPMQGVFPTDLSAHHTAVANLRADAPQPNDATLSLLANVHSVALSPGVSLDPQFQGLGIIDAKYEAEGGEASRFGKKLGPQRNERDAKGRIVRLQICENGTLFSDGLHVWCIFGRTHQHYWEELNGLKHPHLGMPDMDQTRTPDNDGFFVHFKDRMGSIYHGDIAGPCEVHGAIRFKWGEEGWQQGPLGYPVTNETPNDTSPFGQTGSFNDFERGSIFWSPGNGAFRLNTETAGLYRELGGPMGNLGHPIFASSDGQIANFEGGRITRRNGASVLEERARETSMRLVTITANKTTSEPGRDEIKLSIVRINHLGEVDAPISPSDLGQFRDGETKTPTIFSGFRFDPLEQPVGYWPRQYMWSFLLVEKDNGNLDGWHVAFIQAYKDHLKKEIERGLKQLELSAGVLGHIVAAVLSVGLNTALNRVFDRIKNSLTKDTIFKPINLSREIGGVWPQYFPLESSQADSGGWFFIHQTTHRISAGRGQYELRINWLLGVEQD